MSSKDRPVHEIRMGRVKAAIWRNENDSGTWYSVLITRIYKTETGWETSNSFSRDELPLVSKVADLAHTWIYLHANDREETSETENSEGPKTKSRQRDSAHSE